MRRLTCIAINPQWFDAFFLSFPLGLATIVSIVKKSGYKIQVIDFDAHRIDDNEKINFLNSLKIEPDVILLTGMITNYRRIRKLTQIIKTVWPKGIIILGGSLATTAPVEILKKIDADIFVIGEGDEKIKWILEAITTRASLKNIPGVKIKDGNHIYTTSSYHGLPDITTIPRPAYEEFPLRAYIDFFKKSNRCFETYTSKGCPFSCYFCFRISGNKVRFRLVRDIIEEIKFLKDNYQIERFSFEDDNFGIDKQWIKEFCQQVKELDIKFRFQANINTLKEEMLDQLQKVGLCGVSLGLESASPFILKEIGKIINISLAEKVIGLLRQRGIKYNATFIIGSTCETDETIEMTKGFLIRNRFRNNFQIFFLTPYPGTKLYNDVLAKGLISDEVEYIEKLKPQDNINLNLTKYPNEKLTKWRDYLLQGVDLKYKS